MKGLTEAVTGRFRACLVDPEPDMHQEAAGWAKTVDGIAQTVCRGLELARSRAILTLAAHYLGGRPRFMAA